ncbi:hypothetical protein [Fodinibius sediminis]|nr:hypothetical protein [Fodinibius sediminis]
MVKNKHKLGSQLKEMAFGKGTSLKQSDIWDDTYAIGLDTDCKYLFYTTLNESKDILIKFSSLKTCTLSETDTPRGDAPQLDLILERKGSDTLYRLPFKLDSNQTAKKKLAKQWESTINKYIT